MSLKLHDKNLQNISGLEQCISLRTLDMSFNKVQVLEGCVTQPSAACSHVPTYSMHYQRSTEHAALDTMGHGR